MKVFENFVQKLDVENKERLKQEKKERGIILCGESACIEICYLLARAVTIKRKLGLYVHLCVFPD